MASVLDWFKKTRFIQRIINNSAVYEEDKNLSMLQMYPRMSYYNLVINAKNGSSYRDPFEPIPTSEIIKNTFTKPFQTLAYALSNIYVLPTMLIDRLASPTIEASQFGQEPSSKLAMGLKAVASVLLSPIAFASYGAALLGGVSVQSKSVSNTQGNSDDFLSGFEDDEPRTAKQPQTISKGKGIKNIASRNLNPSAVDVDDMDDISPTPRSNPKPSATSGGSVGKTNGRSTVDMMKLFAESKGTTPHTPTVTHSNTAPTTTNSGIKIIDAPPKPSPSVVSVSTASTSSATLSDAKVASPESTPTMHL